MKLAGVKHRQSLNRYITNGIINPEKDSTGHYNFTQQDLDTLMSYKFSVMSPEAKERSLQTNKQTLSSPSFSAPESIMDYITSFKAHIRAIYEAINESNALNIRRFETMEEEMEQRFQALEAKIQHQQEKLDSYIFKSTVLKGTKYGYSKDKTSSSQPAQTEPTNTITTDQKPAHKPKDPKYPIGTLTPKMQQWAKDAKPLTPAEMKEWELQMYGFIEEDEDA